MRLTIARNFKPLRQQAFVRFVQIVLVLCNGCVHILGMEAINTTAAAHAALDASLAAAHAAFDASLAAPLAALARAGFGLADADAAREAAECRGPAIAAFNVAREAAEDRFFTVRARHQCLSAEGC